MNDTATGYQFPGSVAWITGASSGIGAALALEAARRGARLVLSARRRERLEDIERQCREAGAAPGDVLVLPLDVEDHAAMPAAVEQVLARFGRIDLLVNNAGISQRSFCLDTGLEVYRKLLEVDVLGQIALTKAVLPVMVNQGAGRLAVTASVAGKVGSPLRTGYSAAKHAVMGFFDALRTEVAHLGVRVTTIVPGSIHTAVAHNALTGDGSAFARADEFIESGMDPAACAGVVADGLAAGLDEIAVGEGPEMELLELKRRDPVATFRLLESMAADLMQGQSFKAPPGA